MMPTLHPHHLNVRDEQDRMEWRIRIFAVCCSCFFVAVYFVSSFFPESFLWGVNHLAFFDTDTRFVLVLLSLTFTLPVVSATIVSLVEKLLMKLAGRTWIALPTLLLLSMLAGYAFYQFRIATNMYGDSRSVIKLLSEKEYTFRDVIQMHDHEALTRFIHQMIARVFRIDQTQVYQIVSATCGGCFVFLVSWFLIHVGDSPVWKVLGFVMLMTCGANQLFFGHVENYTLVYLCIIIFLILAWEFFEGKNRLTWMWIVFVVGVFLHQLMTLFLPALLYASAVHLRKEYEWLTRWIQPKRLVFVVVGTLFVGVVLYFFYFEANVGSPDQQIRIQKIFLPIINPLPPPHSYSLFSLNHFSDVAQEVLLAVSPASVIVLLLGAVFIHRDKFGGTRKVFYLLGAWYFLLFDFTVNPVLTMPRDWDFLSLAAAPVTFVALSSTVSLFENVRHQTMQRYLVGLLIAPTILSSTFFVINADEQKAGERLESIGVWAYNSYYWGSSYLINVGEKGIHPIDAQIVRREKLLQKLLQNSSDSDVELSFLSQKVGQAYYVKRDYTNAIRFYAKARILYADNAEALKALGVLALLTWRFDVASDLLEAYNERYNDPTVTDPHGLTMAEYANYIHYLISARADSTIIQKKLDEIEVPSN